MTVTPNALYYLNSWDACVHVAGGTAHWEMLAKCRLDYSVSSLSRIDAFIDAIRIKFKPERDDFLYRTENQNLLFFLAFYTGEVVGRAIGVPPQWLSYREATQIALDHENMFSECMETSVCCRYPGNTTLEIDFFHPLYAIVTRLLDGNAGKSIRCSAGLFLTGELDSEPLAGEPTPPFVPGLFGEGEFFQSKGIGCNYAMIRPWWGNNHPIRYVLDNAEHLLEHGRVVWGTFVRANKDLFTPKYVIGACADVIYDPSGRLPVEDLLAIAEKLPALAEQHQANPSFAPIARHLADESNPVFAMALPTALCPQPLLMSSTYIDQTFLPDGMLTVRHFPLLISDSYPGAVIILPWQTWPAHLVETWRSMSRAMHGQEIDSRNWRQQFEETLREEHARRSAANNAASANALYEEGLLYFHGRGVPQDYSAARRLWEQAAALGEANAMNNLGIIYADGLGAEPDLNKAIAFYRSAAACGHVLGQLNIGKTFLREADCGIDREEARTNLQAAARQGSEEAVNLLLRHMR